MRWLIFSIPTQKHESFAAFFSSNKTESVFWMQRVEAAEHESEPSGPWKRANEEARARATRKRRGVFEKKNEWDFVSE